jgi:succinyl-CoA synthetase beta subunit
MKIHEYQAKEILRRHRVPCGTGLAATSVAEAEAAIAELPGPVWVVKSQIHAGGRGMGRFQEDMDKADLPAVLAGQESPGGGGVRVCFDSASAGQAAADMLGKTLITKQTGASGQRVQRLYIEHGCDIARELYLSVLLDRSNGQNLLMASTEGGMNIEDVAEHTPEKIVKVWVDPAIGLGAWQARQLAYGLGLQGKAFKAGVKLIMGIYRVYIAEDCTMIEINPLVVTGEGDVLALDCKMSFDDNALFRHKDTIAMRDLAEEDPAEVEAGEYDLSYIALDGEIGCMVNGAGLAMATMDIIKLFGSSPANFLDVGGGATTEKVTAAFKIITRDPQVKAIMVNIFGGIMKCDVIAQGVITAVREIGLEVPLVVRLAGTHVSEGRELIQKSGLPIITATSMADAAQKAVAAARGQS